MPSLRYCDLGGVEQDVVGNGSNRYFRTKDKVVSKHAPSHSFRLLQVCIGNRSYYKDPASVSFVAAVNHGLTKAVGKADSILDVGRISSFRAS